jgi:hypothetical protein
MNSHAGSEFQNPGEPVRQRCHLCFVRELRPRTMQSKRLTFQDYDFFTQEDSSRAASLRKRFLRPCGIGETP